MMHIHVGTIFPGQRTDTVSLGQLKTTVYELAMNQFPASIANTVDIIIESWLPVAL